MWVSNMILLQRSQYGSSIPIVIQVEQIGIGATADPILESDGTLTCLV